MKLEEKFYKELKALLNKYNAEILLEDCADNSPWNTNQEMVIHFSYNMELEEQTPDIILGSYEGGTL